MTTRLRAYSDAVKWVRSAAPRPKSGRVAKRAFAGTFAAAVPLIALIGLVSPGRFGSPGANTFRSGWPLYVLLGIIALGGLYVGTHAARIRWSIARLREPFVRPFTGDPRFEGAADALATCPPALRTRFGIAWVWVPAAVTVLGGMFSFAAAYFVVDAVLARFKIGWQQPATAAASAVIAYLLFRSVARRLLTWRLAVSVHKSVTTGY